MRKFGLAAILTFVDKGASSAMGRIGAKAELLKKRFGGVGAGLKQVSRGMGQVALAGAPLAAAFLFAARDGAKFEQSIANLRAISLDVANKTTPKLEALAQTLGATTVFSASQAADAMTALKRGGLEVSDILGGAVVGTLKAAAAEGIDLAEAAGLVVSNLNAFGLSADQAGAVAGKLALVSARTNTNMLQLQEGLKFGAIGAKAFGVGINDVVATLGALADIGVQATQSGTALRQMFARLADPPKKMQKGFKALGLDIEEVRERMGKGQLVDVMKDIVLEMGKFESNAKRAQISSQIFGIRAAALGTAFDLTDKKAARFAKTVELLGKETGQTAEKMAELKLDSLIGQLTLLRSATEAVNIQVFKLFGVEAKGGAIGLATTLQDLALAMRVVAGEEITDPADQAKIQELSTTMLEVASGIKEAFGDVKETLSGVLEAARPIASALGIDLGEGGAKGITKLIVKMGLLTAAMAPIGLAVLGLTKLFGGFGNIAIGALRGTVGAAKGIGGSLLSLFRGKGLGLGGAAGAISKATANRVFVVNFDEVGGGLGGIGGKKGGVPFGPQQPVKKVTGLFTRMAKGLGRLVLKIPLLGPALSGIGSIAGKVGTKMAGSLLGKAGLVGLAGAAGFALGTLINDWTGASTFIADTAFNLFKKPPEPKRGDKNQVAAGIVNAKIMAETILRGAQLGNLTFGRDKTAITEENARAKITSFLAKQGVTGAELIATLKGLNGTLSQISAAQGIGTQGPAIGIKQGESVGVLRDASVLKAGFARVSAGDVILDRAELARAVGSRIRGGRLGDVGLGQGDPGSVVPPPAGMSEVTIPVSLNVDGREIALAVARVNLDDLERAGTNLEPGDRSALLQRGFRNNSGGTNLGGL